jgi:hypothetical protein
MPEHLAVFDADDWPLPPLVVLEVDDDGFLLAKRRRAWRTARRAWLAANGFPELAAAEGRTCSREYAGALRRAQVWRVR